MYVWIGFQNHFNDAKRLNRHIRLVENIVRCQNICGTNFCRFTWGLGDPATPHKRPIPTWFPEIFLGFLLLDLSPVGGEAEALDVLVKRDRFQERHRPLVVHQIQRQVDVLKRAEIFSKCLKKPSGKTCHQQWRLQGSSHPHCSPLSSFVICVHPPTLPCCWTSSTLGSSCWWCSWSAHRCTRLWGRCWESRGWWRSPTCPSRPSRRTAGCL